jgi:Family of unknown function (DUF6328)
MQAPGWAVTPSPTRARRPLTLCPLWFADVPGWLHRHVGEDAKDGGENPKERVDRELIELLNELRVALPGVQVLFAFLLTMPLTDRFGDLTDAQRLIYFATFTATTLASALLMAPTSYHRLRFREGHKEQMLYTANRLAIAGTVLLALAIGGAALLVADLTYGVPLAVVFGIAVLVFIVALWFVLPLTRKARDQ